ncbi:MAG: O-antigen ligase family protein [Promethearchaeota archaeon]
MIVLFSRPIIDNIDPLRTITLPIVGVNVLQLLGIAIPFTLVIVCILQRGTFFKYYIGNVYFIFLLTCIPAIFISQDIVQGFAEWLRLFVLWAVFIFSTNVIKTRIDIHQVLALILISSFYPTLKFLSDIITGSLVEIGNIERVIGGYFHMSIISCMLLFFIPSYLYFFHNSLRKFYKGLYLLGVPILLISIYLTKYRTALVGAFVFFFTFFILKKKWFLLFILVAAAIVGIAFNSDLQQRFNPLITALYNIDVLFDPNDNQFDDLLSGRFGIWRNLLKTYFYRSEIQNLFFGFGAKPKIRHLFVSPHNDYLSYLFHFGVLSLMSFCIFITALLVKGLKYNSNLIPQLITSLVMAFAVMAMSHGTFQDVRNLLYLGTYIGLMVKYFEIYENLNEELTRDPWISNP